MLNWKDRGGKCFNSHKDVPRKKKKHMMYANFKRTKYCTRFHTVNKIRHFSACTFSIYIKMKLEL